MKLAAKLWRRAELLGQRTVTVLICKVAATIMLLGANALLARMLGVSGYGELSYIITVVNLAVALALVGFQGLSVREIGYLQAARDHLGTRHFVVRTLRVLVFTSAGAVAIAWFGLQLLGYPAPSMATIMLVGLGLIPALAFIRAGQAIVQGLNRPIFGVLPEFVLRPFLLLVLAGAVWLTTAGAPQSPQTMIWLHVVSAGIAMAAALVLVRRLLPPAEGAGARKPFGLYLRDGAPFFLSAMLAVLNLQLPILLLGNIADPTAVGLYRPASLIADTLAFVLIGLNIPLRPLVARGHKLGQTDELQRQITWATRIMFLVAASGALFFIAFGKHILALFGDDFEAAYVMMVILCVGKLSNVAFGPVALVLNMTGHARFTVYGMALGVLVNVVGGLALIPFYGGVGAAIGAALSMFTWNATLAVLAHRRTGINTTLFAFGRPPAPTMGSGEGRA